MKDNKVKNEVAVAEVTPDLPKETVVDPVQSTVEEGFDVDFSFGMAKHNDGSRIEYVYHISDKPQVIIAGKEVALKEIADPQTTDRYGYSYGGDKQGIYIPKVSVANHTNPTDCAKPLKWYGCTLGGVEIRITNGSSLLIAESISGVTDYFDRDSKDKTVLTVRGSRIECKTLDARGSTELDNTVLWSKGYVFVGESTIRGSVIRASDQIIIKKTTGADVSVNQTNAFNIYESTVKQLDLTGFDSTTLDTVTTYAPFELNVGYRPTPGLGLNIKDITLVAFSGKLWRLGEMWSQAYPGKGTYTHNINIIRRTDYGYFSGLSSIPFVRIGSYDVGTPKSLYKGSEVDPVSFPAPAPKPVYSVRPFYSNEPQPVTEPAWGSTYRGGTLWEKARAEIFGGFEGEQQPVGKAGEGLINTFMEQLRSRTSLYVEINSLTAPM